MKRPSKSPKNCKTDSGNSTQNHWGISLLEVTMVILLLSAALVPVVMTMGGQTGSGAAPTISALNEQTLIRSSASSSLIERALTGNVVTSNVTSQANLTNPIASGMLDPNNLPQGGTATFGPYSYKINPSDPDLSYSWTLKDVSYQDQNGTMTRVSPKGNRVVKADLQIFAKNPDTGTYLPKESSTTYLYVKEPLQVLPDPYVGVSLVADVSGSMCDSLKYNLYSQRQVNGLCHPYLNDRFERDLVADPFPTTTTTKGGEPGKLNISELNLFDDRQLDIAFSLPVDDPSTPNKENFMQRGVLGMPPVYAGAYKTKNDQGVQAVNPDSYCSLYLNSADAVPMHANLKWLFFNGNETTPDWAKGNKWANQEKDMLYALCKDGSTMKNDKWLANTNPYISRYEAMRGALLGFLMKLERDQELVGAMSMALSTFSDSAQVLIPMKGPVTTIRDPETSTYRPRFDEVRRQIAWINRYDVKQKGLRTIRSKGATNTEGALLKGAKAFDGDNRVNSRHLIILTDGEPTMGNTNRDYLKSLAEAIHKSCRDGSGNYAASTTGPTMPCSTNQDDWVKVNVVGFAGIPAADEQFLTDLATRGGGRYLRANNVQELQQALFTLSYDIKRSMIMKRVERYNSQMASQL